MLKKLTPNLMVEDVNRTIAFYTEVLGFETVATVPEAGQLDWAWMQRDDVQVMFQARASLDEEIPALKDVPIGASQTFYIEVTGVQELYAQLTDKVEIVADLHTTFYGTSEFAFRDLNGYILSFSEAVQQA
jgi:uncharacterized glyoxalase superfamily protein PhnB